MENKLIKYLYIKYYAFCIAMCFFFSQYEPFVKGISIADFMLLICVLSILFVKKIKIKYTNSIMYYYFISLILFLIALSIYGFNFPLVPLWKVVSRLIRYGFYALLILLVVDNPIFKDINANTMLKIYRLFCYFFAIYAICQAFAWIFAHYVLPTNILPIPWSRETDTNYILLQAQNNYFRVCGPFQEPSYFAKFILPGLTFSLFGWYNKGKIKIDWILAIIIIGAIVLSTSVQGIMIAAITFFIYFVYFNKLSPIKKLSITCIILILGGIFLATNSSSISMDRINALIKGDTYGYSAGLRVFRGFAFWYEMPLIFKIIGTGLGNMGNFAHIYDIYTIYDHPFREINFLEYCSGLSGILVQTGILGFSLISCFFYKAFNSLNFVGKVILFQFFLILLSGSSFFSVLTIFYCALIFFNIRE